MIYLDNNATTRIPGRVLDSMLPYLREDYANPSGPYGFSRRAAGAVEQARQELGVLLAADAGSLVFCSGGTEANNASLHAALAARPHRNRVLISAVEHESILQPCLALPSGGVRVDRIPVSREGELRLADYRDLLGDDVAVVCVMGANNETGVCFDLEPLVQAAHQSGALFHADLTQCVGKVPINIGGWGLDSAAISAHKFHGPKGVGAMFVGEELADYTGWQRGGDQEKGRRAGTLNVAGIVGCGAAARWIRDGGKDPIQGMAHLRDAMEAAILQTVPHCTIHGESATRLPNTSSLRFAGVESEALLALLDQAGICCSSGSACMAASSQPSHVMEAMGLTGRERYEVIRVSLSRFTTEAEIGILLDTLPGLVDRIRTSQASVIPPS